MENRFKTAAEYVNTLGTSNYLFENIWEENTTALIHSPRETDKTAAALAIACDLTDAGNHVFYITTGRLAPDHRSKVAGNTLLYIHTPEYQSPDDTTDYADLVIADIEAAISSTPARIFIVDSVSRIAALSFGRNASAAYVMKRLVALQVRCGLSLLVISHDSTRSADRALLNLSDSEITLTAEPVPTAEFDNSDNSDSSDSSDSSDKSNQSDAPSRRNLSRRDRRLLRRQQQSRKPDKIK